jgi:peptidoglycan/xylan/chitin deacetylase (PgdA/CDA1 family)
MTLASLRSHAARPVKSLLFCSGFYEMLRRGVPSRRLAILRYHAICEPGVGYADRGICVSPAAFARHVQYLAAHYSVVPLPQAVAVLRRGGTLPANAVAITFDDGYADNLAAARVLHGFGLPATFYLTAGCLAGEQPFWPAEIRSLIAAVPEGTLLLAANGSRIQIPVHGGSDRSAAVTSLSCLFKRHPIHVREALRQQLRHVVGTTSIPECMLTWEAVAEMDRLGMTIGSHTLTHPNLPSAGAADAWREIYLSKVRLERELGKPVTMFSYPNGGAEQYVTSDVATLVRKAGYEAATTSRNAFAGPRSDVYALERVQVHERLEDLVFALEVERFAFSPGR